MEKLCERDGYASPVNLLLEIGMLPKEKYEQWRGGRVDYLERVCTANLHQLALVLTTARAFALKHGLKQSQTVYVSYGPQKKRLRFSKSGEPGIEKHYATHFVCSKDKKG